MISNQSIASKKIVFLLIMSLIWVVSGCSYLSSFFSSSNTADSDQQDSTTAGSSIIYIQSITGQSVKEFQEIFFNTIREQSTFRFVELLPDSLVGLRILRIDIQDFTIWENEELFPSMEKNVLSTTKQPNKILRRNANISMKVSLFNAKTGDILIRKVFSQPYQQIYVGEKAIQSRPDKLLELQRLTKLIVFRMLTAFEKGEEENILNRLEIGYGTDWFSRHIWNLGNSRIKKGNRFALSGDIDQAILVWKLTLFQSEDKESQENSLENRASAYYNLGIVFSYQNDWWQASDMFSKANRLCQKIKYAQAWGESMQKWLDSQKTKQSVQAAAPITPTTPESKPTAIRQTEKKPLTIRNIEQNDQLLLKPKELWPLDPVLKHSLPEKID